MEHTKASCESCDGIENCSKYCPIRVGENIVNFVNSIDQIETDIGEISTGNDKKSYINIGTIFENYGTPTRVLKAVDNNISMAVQGKFENYMGMTPTQLLKEYTKYRGISKNSQNKAVEELNKVNSNKIVPDTIKIGSEIECKYTGGDGRQHKATAKVNMIKFSVNESGRLVGTIMVDAGRFESSSTKVKLKYSEYGETWTLPKLEQNLKTSDITREIIKMNDNGLIHPIEISDGKNTIAIDSQHMYLVESKNCFIVGNWESSKIKISSEYADKVENTKAYKKFKQCLTYIDRHRRFIVPYGLSSANHIDV